MAPPNTPFYETVARGDFFTLSDEVILRQIHDEYTPELERLKRAYSVRGPDASPGILTKPSPSQILYNSNYDEVNRTLIGVLALRWLLNGDYDSFTNTQCPSMTLKKTSFQWMRRFIGDRLQDHNDLYALVTSVMINDLGKDPQ